MPFYKVSSKQSLDEIYNALVSIGVTPESDSVEDIVEAIKTKTSKYTKIKVGSRSYAIGTRVSFRPWYNGQEGEMSVYINGREIYSTTNGEGCVNE